MSAPEELCKALLDKEDWTRSEAAFQKLRNQSREEDPVISGLLLKGLGARRGYSYYGLCALAFMGTAEGKQLVYDLATGDKADPRGAALSALGYLHEAHAFEVLMAAALGRRPSDAEYALEGLRNRGDRAAIPALVERLKTAKPAKTERACDFVMAAFRTLIQIAPEDSGVADIVASLIKAPVGKESWDTEFCFREVVEKSTKGNCQAPAVMEALKAVIAGSHDARKPLAAAALGRLTGNHGVWMPVILQALTSQIAGVRTGAGTALEWVGPEAWSILDAAAKAEKNVKNQKLLAAASRTLRGRLQEAGIEIPGSEVGQGAGPKDPFQALETELGLKLPELHRRLFEAGLTNVPPDWKDNWKRYWVERPPVLVNACGEVDWLSPQDMLKAQPPGYWKTNLSLVQFAREGAGDSYCYRLDWEHKGGIPIVLAAHDDNEARCLAPHLEGFIFRELLLAMVDMYLDGQFALEELIRSLRAEVAQLQGYLRQEWLDLLSSILDREPVREVVQVVKKVNYAHLISRDEAKRILSKQLAFEHLDETFEHME